MKWSQENGKSMWVSVSEQKSQIEIEQQPWRPCDCQTPAVERQRYRENETEGERNNGMYVTNGETDRWRREGLAIVKSETMKH